MRGQILNNKSYVSMREMLMDYLPGFHERAGRMGVPGIPMGHRGLDDLTGGFENGKVYVVGSRPCMGKEEFMLSMLLGIVLKSKLPALLFSTNHLKSDYIQQLLAMHCDIPTLHLHKGYLEECEWERLDKRLGTLLDAPLFVHDSLDLPLDTLLETAQNCIRENGIRIIFVDCLQMIDFAKEGGSPSERIAKVMYSLKQLATLNDVPVVVGSMLGREIEYREGFEGRRPQLTDLADSSYIEELADVVMMVYRPEYYHIYQTETGRDLHGLIEIIVRKNALKPLGSFFLDYHQETGIIESKSRFGSKPVRLKDLGEDNKAVKFLVDSFGLEEESPS